MYPACEVTACVIGGGGGGVGGGQQYPGPGNAPHTDIYVAPERFGKKI